MTASRDRILELFRQSRDRFVSGEQICRELGISRSAVWKHIRHLRELGYDIEATPSKGYALRSTPDALIPAEIMAGLPTSVIGREVVFLPETDSTNLQARLLAEQGAAEGTVVIADRQSHGKGRMGRFWISPPGVNLYLSVILRPHIPLSDATQLTFLTAVAVAGAIESVGLQPQLKWPNDVLINHRKVAGLLNELNAETERVHFLVLGIGVNLNMEADRFPRDLRTPATSLMIESGAPVSRLSFVRALLREIDDYYALYRGRGFRPVLDAWEKRCHMIGRKVEVDYQHSRLVGTVKGLDEAGALLLTLADGRIERVLAGDITILQ